MSHFKTPMRRTILSIYFLAALTPLQLSAAAIDIAPGDLSAPQSNYSVATLTQNHAKYSGIYMQGRITRARELHVNETNLNFTAFKAAKNWHPYFVSVGVPYLELREENEKTRAKGTGDLQLGAGVWPIHRPETGMSLGAGLSVSLPTGRYDKEKSLNPGQNRRLYNALIRYRSSTFKSFWLDLMAQKTWFENNPSFLGRELRSDSAEALTLYLARRLISHDLVFIGYEKNWGGESYLENAKINHGQYESRVQLGWRKPLSQRQELVFRTSASLEVKNGYKQDLRLSISLNYKL